MKIKSYNRGEAQNAMSDWVANYPDLPDVDPENAYIRKDIQELNKKVRSEAAQIGDSRRTDYYVDSHFGLELYEYLWNQPGFSMRTAANDGFWRYLSLAIAPDVVAQRWGKDNSDHYWSKPTRIWFRSIWWYVHLAWQGDMESTRKVLETSYFTTDTILNFEERNGRKGTCVDAYREIIKLYSIVPEEIIRQNSRGKTGSDDLFRVVMKLNTAKMMVMEPALCANGEKGYALSLFKDAGVELNVT